MIERCLITVLVVLLVLPALAVTGHRLTTTFCHVEQAWQPLLVCPAK